MVKISRAKERELYESLVRTESELRVTLYSIGDGVISVDMDGRVLMMNPVAEKLTGWEELEGRGMSLEEVFHIINEETRTEVENPVKRVLREGTVIGLANHTILIARDGTERAIADCGSPIYDKEGRVTGVVLVFRDQTEKRKAEKAVAEALAFAQSIIATVREPLVILDAGLRILSANRAFYQVFEVMPEETEGCLLYELGDRQWDIPELRKLLEDILPQNTSFNDYEVEHDFPRIGRMTMLLNARRIYREANKTEMILLAIEDITERKQVEKALRESEESFRAVTEKANDGIIIASSDGTHLYANRRASEITGYSVEELLKIGMRGLTHPDEIPKLSEILKKRLSGEEVPSHYETKIIRKDGKTLEVEISGARIFWHGQVASVVIIRDISERKKTLEILKASEDKYRALVERSLQGILIVQNFRIVYANERCAEIIGYPVEELLSLPTEKVVALVHPEDQALVWGRFKDRLEGKDVPPHYEYRGIRKDGSTRWLEMFSSLIEYLGKPAVLAALVDRTGRKRLEEILRLSEEKFSKAFKASPAWIVISSLEEGRYIEVNDAFLKSTGFSRDEVVGQSALKLNIWYDPRDRVRLISELKEKGSARNKEVKLRKKSGELLDILLSAEVVEIAGEKCMLSASLDITERKRAEEALRESEEKYRLLVENAGDVIAIVQDGYFRFINRRATELLGYSLDELMPRPFWEIIHPEDREKVLESYSKRLGGEETPAVYSFRVVDKEGNVKWAEIHVVPISYGGRPGALNFIRDITERKRAEAEMASLQEQLRQSQKMEAIGRLAGGIAHDFNNLLTVIKGNSQLSLMDLQEGDPLKKNLEEIRSASDRAADLTKQLLAFSRKQILEMRVIDLNTIVKNLEKMVRRIIGEDIELVTFLTEGLGRVRADPSQMEQAIINIVVNARDAMPRGGKLTIETSNMELDEAYAKKHIAVKPGPYVMLSISDTGVGMTPEVRERVFEPFFTTKEMGKGTGLGLSTVYGIVKQSGGNIWVYSEVGKGTTFKIYLPRVEEPLEELKEEAIKEIPQGSETVLIVEDEEVVRKLALRLLRKQGYKVLEASDGGKAFLLCEEYKEPIHLILTDVVMPGMGGRDLVERLKRIHPEARALYMSGYTDNVILHHGILEKGIDFIQKPFTLESLARKVREVLDK
jgi:PAS domain S-box-containing protein